MAGNSLAVAAVEPFIQHVKSLNQPNSPYTKCGFKPTKAMLFYGPPGTGKTFFAQALAGETGCPFVLMRCSELNELYMGIGSKRTRESFDHAKELAKKAKKPCILFIDEIDAIGMDRSHNISHEYITQTLTSMLTRIGTPEYSDVLVIMATNRRDSLDSALTRSGRTNIEIEFNLPNEAERLAILNIYLSNFHSQLTVFYLVK